MTDEPRRPTAEEMLARIRALERPASEAERYSIQTGDGSLRGKLRIYLGAAPGVGKTYAMLQEGHRLRAAGVDVVIGLLETHGRKVVAELAADLPVIPRKKIPYKGMTVEEMDTAAILARKPQVVLVDELAHTNAPGATHPKRYEDVEDLLAAGINVITTVNVQHLESMNDLVEDITGVRVRETIPDRIVDGADEIQLVDIPPEQLRLRLEQGLIYPADRAQAALKNFFRQGNLAALRELALRRMAQKVDTQLEAYMEDHQITDIWPATDRVLVCVTATPFGAEIVRHAWRIGSGFKAELAALTVVPPGGLDRLAPARRQALQRTLNLAEDLGFTTEIIAATDIAHAIVEYAVASRITQIVVGQPQKSRWEELVRGSVVNRLLRLVHDIDVHVVAVHRPSRT